jgi:4'-phosphopantetheinyl transferase
MDGPVDVGKATPCSAELWSASIRELDRRGEMACLSLLDDDERERAAAFRVESARRLYILAHALGRIMLGALVDRPPDVLRFATERRGKPRLDLPEGGAPAFNLSHSGHLAVGAATWGVPIGVDVEVCRRDALTLDLVRDLLALEELRILERLEGERLTEALVAVWTGKEAVVKAHGDGLYLRLDRFVVPLGDGPVRLDAELAGTFGPVWRLHRFAPDPDHRIALVLALSPQAPLTIRRRHLTVAEILAAAAGV